MAASVQYHISQNQIAIDAVPEAPQPHTQKWYFSRKEIECNTPSRSDGIDYKYEQHLRKMYCNYMQELGIELKVPQVTIATAMMFCHRFYMHQSHAKNDWQTVATSCMFLACKAEETPRGLGELVVVAYKLIYKWDPSATRRIREIYDKQKDLIVTGERLLLTTIAFDMNIEHPYKKLVAVLKKLDIRHKELAKVAWNFVNDWLRTSLCLQHKPNYIAAGSLFLAAKVKKVKLPTSKEKAWWMEFGVSPKLLEDVIQQMMSLWEQSQSQTLAPKEQKVTGSQTIKATTYSPQSTLSGHKVIQDSKTIASKGDGEPRKSTMSKCTKKHAFDNVHDTSKIDRHANDNGNASSVVENSKILASMDQSSKTIASKDAGVPAKKHAFDNVHDTFRATIDCHTSVNGNASSAVEDSKILASMDQSSKTIASKDAGEPAKTQAFDNVRDASRATTDCHTSGNGNASSVVEDSKIHASLDQSSKTIASKDAGEPAKSSMSDCAKEQTSRATTDRHTSVNGNARSLVENSKIHASTDLCLTAKSVSFECDEKQAFDNVNGTSQDIPICQTSDPGSAVSVIEDGDSGEPVTVKSDLSSSCNTVKLGGTAVSSQVDVNRIREKLKKRNSIKTMKRKRVEDTDDEMDGEAWIERELENGIVLDSSYPEKQRKI